jgi:hypothetical protein
MNRNYLEEFITKSVSAMKYAINVSGKRQIQSMHDVLRLSLSDACTLEADKGRQPKRSGCSTSMQRGKKEKK